MKIRLWMLGKTRREEVRVLLDDYLERLGRYASVEVTEVRDAHAAAQRKIKFEPGTTVVLLDAALWIGDLRDRAVRALVFLCGDAEGFPPELRAAARHKISLSTLTMPHELARVVLAEQLYRAFAILHGHPYPK